MEFGKLEKVWQDQRKVPEKDKGTKSIPSWSCNNNRRIPLFFGLRKVIKRETMEGVQYIRFDWLWITLTKSMTNPGYNVTHRKPLTETIMTLFPSIFKFVLHLLKSQQRAASRVCRWEAKRGDQEGVKNTPPFLVFLAHKVKGEKRKLQINKWQQLSSMLSFLV
jgi:hypothetical protein